MCFNLINSNLQKYIMVTHHFKLAKNKQICQFMLVTSWHYKSSELVSWESEATPSATPFFKRAYKFSIFPDYERPGLICLALPPPQKFGLILVIKWLKNWCYQKVSITKNVLLNCTMSWWEKKGKSAISILTVSNSSFAIK